MIFLSGYKMNKTVIITGGTRGIGASCVKKFAKNNWKVAFLYKTSNVLAKSITGEFENTFAYKCDVACPAEVKNTFEQIVDNFGHIDVLVNNAGVSHTSLLQDMTDEEWQKIVDTNLSSVFYTSKAVIPSMVSAKCGTIINISSMWGVVGASCEVAYSAVKAGVIGFTKALAKELGPSGVRVNAVAPGVINTDMLSCYSKEDLDALAKETPLERLGTPEDIAEIVYFLSGDSSDFITGQVFNVNGGFVI